MDTVDGERVLTQASVVSGTLATTDVPKPLLMACHAVGGAAKGLQDGMLGGCGLNNIGLLVRVVGKVQFIDPAGNYVTISDGSLVWDVYGHAGIQIWAPGMFPTGLTTDDTLTVTGISSCYKSGGDLYPKILVKTAGDIVKQ